MAGIFPDGGTTIAQTTNGVDVPTKTGTKELFYATSRCQPRFEPAQANAVISELLNVMKDAGHEYDPSVLTNLSSAMTKSNGIKTATAGTAIQPGNIVKSSDNVLMYNGTTAAITPAAAANITSAGLKTLGLTRVHATVSTATATGNDNFGNTYASGDELITFPGGQVLAIAAVTINNASGTVKGIVEVATPAEIRDGTTTGATGAQLAITPNNLRAVATYDAASGAQGPLSAVNGGDKVLVKDVSGTKMYWADLEDLVPAMASRNPFGTGQTAADWMISVIVTNGTALPAGPAGVPGYWEGTIEGADAATTAGQLTATASLSAGGAVLQVTSSNSHAVERKALFVGPAGAVWSMTNWAVAHGNSNTNTARVMAYWRATG